MQNYPVDIDKSLRVTACPHPFKIANQEYSFAPTISLSQILKEVQPDLLLGRYAHIWVNEEYILPENWETTFPIAGSSIAIRVIPGGKKGGIFRIIGMVVITILAIVATVLTYGALGGPALTGTAAMWAGAAASLAGMAVGIVGNLILNALIPVVSPSSKGALGNLSAVQGAGLDYGQTSPTLSITGASNKENLYGPIPRMLGRFKNTPPYGARTYTESASNDQYLRLLFVWGFSGLQIENPKIGTNPIDNFIGVEVEHRNLTLHRTGQTIAIDVVAKTLTRTTGSWIIDGVNFSDTVVLDGCATEANNTSYTVKAKETPNPTGVTVVLEKVLTYETSTATTSEAGTGFQTITVEFGDEDITLYPETIKEEALGILLEHDIAIPKDTDGEVDEISVDVVCPNGLFVADMYTGSKGNKTVDIDIYYRLKTIPESRSWIFLATEEGFTEHFTSQYWVEVPVQQTGELFSYMANYLRGPTGYYVTSSWDTVVPPKSLILSGAEGSAVRKNISWTVPRGIYEVKLVRRTADDGANPFASSITYWSSLRSIKTESPLLDLPYWLNPATEVYEPRKLSYTAMRIKASGQLSGTVSEYSAVATSICPDWDTGRITSVSIANGGTGYVVGDILTIVQDNIGELPDGANGTVRVTSVGPGGVVTGVQLVTIGTKHSSGYVV